MQGESPISCQEFSQGKKKADAEEATDCCDLRATELTCPKSCEKCLQTILHAKKGRKNRIPNLNLFIFKTKIMPKYKK